MNSKSKSAQSRTASLLPSKKESSLLSNVASSTKYTIFKLFSGQSTVNLIICQRTHLELPQMVNPGVFRGSRFAFLIGEKPAYKAGVDGGYAADALANIQSRYFRRYPVELSLDEEPSPEFLDAVNDGAPDIEQQQPDPEELTDVEYKAEVERLKIRSDLIDTRKKVSCCLFISKSATHRRHHGTATQALVCISVSKRLGHRSQGFWTSKPVSCPSIQAHWRWPCTSSPPLSGQHLAQAQGKL